MAGLRPGLLNQMPTPRPKIGVNEYRMACEDQDRLSLNDWNQLFQEQGYLCIQLEPDPNRVQEIKDWIIDDSLCLLRGGIVWCRDNDDNAYLKRPWSFWFDFEEDAVLFSLKWS